MAREIVYDVQFTEPTDARDDEALYDAVAHARNVIILATSEVDVHGHTGVFGGDANHAHAAAANLIDGSSGVVRAYPRALRGLSSLALAAATAIEGRAAPARDAFPGGQALIDSRGPAGTIAHVSFGALVRGRLLAMALAAGGVALAARRRRLRTALALALGLAAAWTVTVVVAFDAGLVLPYAPPDAELGGGDHRRRARLLPRRQPLRARARAPGARTHAPGARHAA
jgi:CHASE2 domain-containing sensor protein